MEESETVNEIRIFNFYLVFFTQTAEFIERNELDLIKKKPKFLNFFFFLILKISVSFKSIFEKNR